MPPFLPFSRPALTRADIDAVIAVLESGWITTGSKVQELEQAICELTGCKHAVAVCSATAGMHILLHALNIGPGDEVITPSMTWVSTVNMIVLRGATPVFVDVDPDTLMLAAESVRGKITARTRLIIPVHYAGASADLDPLYELAAAHGIAVAEDCAHALGTEYRGRPIGQLGTTIFSFHAIKNVTTAEGGMVCTNDGELAARLKRLRFHGLEADTFDRETQGRAPQAEVVEPGFKYNLADMNACLAIGQLKRLPDLNGQRAILAGHYLERLQGLDGVLPLGLPDYSNQHAWHLFVVRVDPDKLGISREEFMRALKIRNIGSGIHFKAAHKHKYYREAFPDAGDDLPNTNWNSDRIVSLPLFPDMTLADVDRVVLAIEEIVKEAKV
ncbi:MAG: aminotransferase class I/II-fold pyridoxal phosphate-dependent enzyme [Gammaproteobacteria bacterium]|nr:aminotransferase class I/II-fold pyridoxal phosphate-dependent enzyme [Gammaproteobacteria bacterium]